MAFVGILPKFRGWAQQQSFRYSFDPSVSDCVGAWELGQCLKMFDGRDGFWKQCRRCVWDHLGYPGTPPALLLALINWEPKSSSDQQIWSSSPGPHLLARWYIVLCTFSRCTSSHYTCSWGVGGEFHEGGLALHAYCLYVQCTTLKALHAYCQQM